GHHQLFVDIQAAAPLVHHVHDRLLSNERAGHLAASRFLYVLPAREPQCVLPTGTQVEFTGGLAAPVSRRPPALGSSSPAYPHRPPVFIHAWWLVEPWGIHWSTSVAWSSTCWGIASPSAWAVLRLMMKSKVVGCSTGSSAG